MIPTFIVDPPAAGEAIIVLRGLEARHALTVMRMKAGEMIRAIDGRGTAYTCEITAVVSGQVQCRILETCVDRGEPRLKLTLAIGLSTGQKFDTVVEKGTEVGVNCIVPLVTSKGKIKNIDAESGRKKAARWRRIAEAAAKQSGRSVIPSIHPAQEARTFIETCHPARTILFHPEGALCRLGDRLIGLPEDRLTIIVGPESGFTPEEVAFAKERGIFVAGMGERVLRTETAGIVLSALAIYSYETVNDRS